MCGSVACHWVVGVLPSWFLVEELHSHSSVLTLKQLHVTVTERELKTIKAVEERTS